MLLERFLVLVSFVTAGTASNVLLPREAKDLEARRFGPLCIQDEVIVVEYPVLINQFFTANEIININGGITINIDNAPTFISTVVTATTTSGSASSNTASIDADENNTTTTGSATITLTVTTTIALSAPASTQSVSTIPPTSSLSTASLLSSLSSTSTSSSAPTSSSSATSTDPFIAGMLFWHNYYRANDKASPLTWNTTLATYAQNYGNQCIFQHTHGPYGENLASGTYTNYNYYVYLWYNEYSSYNFNSPDTSNFESWGHFSQVVWQATTQVGCGWTTGCSFGNYLVCEYAPPGNYLTQSELQANVLPLTSTTFNIPPAT